MLSKGGLTSARRTQQLQREVPDSFAARKDVTHEQQGASETTDGILANQLDQVAASSGMLGMLRIPRHKLKMAAQGLLTKRQNIGGMMPPCRRITQTMPVTVAVNMSSPGIRFGVCSPCRECALDCIAIAA